MFLKYLIITNALSLHSTPSTHSIHSTQSRQLQTFLFGSQTWNSFGKNCCNRCTDFCGNPQNDCSSLLSKSQKHKNTNTFQSKTTPILNRFRRGTSQNNRNILLHIIHTSKTTPNHWRNTPHMKISKTKHKNTKSPPSLQVNRTTRSDTTKTTKILLQIKNRSGKKKKNTVNLSKKTISKISSL